MRSNFIDNRFAGSIVAVIIIAAWLGSLTWLLSIDIDRLTLVWILAAILGRTFIQTGLFILAHDAIHGCVYPPNAGINHAIGKLAVTLYACLDYQKLTIAHWQHHQHPGEPKDPDFHDCNGLLWYLKFMQGYMTKKQITSLLWGMGVFLIVLYFGLQASPANLLLFWILPIFLSSIQLFFFGTYLPHRPRVRVGDSLPLVTASALPNRANSHRAVSSNFPPIVSFFTCYHFGYHWEHHEYPALPWYRLPSAHRDCLWQATPTTDPPATAYQSWQ